MILVLHKCPEMPARAWSQTLFAHSLRPPPPHSLALPPQPYSEKAESDVIVLRAGVSQASGRRTQRRQLGGASPSPSSPPPPHTGGNLKVELFTREHNNSTDAPDECGAIYNIKSASKDGLESALAGACATWDDVTQTFVAHDGCRLANPTEHGANNSRWSMQCDCTVDKKTLEDSMAMGKSGNNLLQTSLPIDMSAVDGWMLGWDSVYHFE